MAKKINLTKGQAVQLAPAADDTCYCTLAVAIMAIALACLSVYTYKHARYEFRRGVGKGACIWELQRGQYISGAEYGCTVSIDKDFYVGDVKIERLD